jgi:hypothetical protein
MVSLIRVLALVAVASGSVAIVGGVIRYAWLILAVIAAVAAVVRGLARSPADHARCDAGRPRGGDGSGRRPGRPAARMGARRRQPRHLWRVRARGDLTGQSMFRRARRLAVQGIPFRSDFRESPRLIAVRRVRHGHISPASIPTLLLCRMCHDASAAEIVFISATNAFTDQLPWSVLMLG